MNFGKAKSDMLAASVEWANALGYAKRSFASRVFSVLLFSFLLLTQLVVAGLSYDWLLTEQFPSAVMGATAFLIILASLRYLAFDFTLWLSVSISLHVVLGVKMDFYQTLFGYDKLVHLFMMAWLVLLISCFLHQRFLAAQITFDVPIRLVVDLTLALALGAAWEMFEFTIDQTRLFNSQLGLDDTMLDLFADALGGLVAFGIAFWKHGKPIVGSEELSNIQEASR